MNACVCLLLAICVTFCSASSGAASFYGGSASGSNVVSGYSSVTSSGSFTAGTNSVATNVRGTAWISVNLNVASNNCGIPYSSASVQVYDTANSSVVASSVLPSSGSLSQSVAVNVQANSVLEARLVLTGSCSASVSGVVMTVNLPISV